MCPQISPNILVTPCFILALVMIMSTHLPVMISKSCEFKSWAPEPRASEQISKPCGATEAIQKAPTII
jgi:hypothetical protein